MSFVRKARNTFYTGAAIGIVYAGAYGHGAYEQHEAAERATNSIPGLIQEGYPGTAQELKLEATRDTDREVSDLAHVIGGLVVTIVCLGGTFTLPGSRRTF